MFVNLNMFHSAMLYRIICNTNGCSIVTKQSHWLVSYDSNVCNYINSRTPKAVARNSTSTLDLATTVNKIQMLNCGYQYHQPNLYR